ncbi:MAG: dihydropteroate synthase, partial [Actinomycetota bacterium]|nr:dihydropteroate synthase [Actinomycetota bacterium]MED5439619.1 dihydropteroate synthase [Actinomycetota bacterium]
MGILNRTPDSFWDRGRFWDFDDFLRLADQHVANGAD